MKARLIAFAILTACLFSCSKNADVQNEGFSKAVSMISPLLKEKDIDRILSIIDSMEQRKQLDATHADFLRGLGYDMSWNIRLAEHYYSKAFHSYKKPVSDMRNYVEAGYRLSVMLMNQHNYQDALSLSSQLLIEGEGEASFPPVFHAYLYTNVADCQIKLHQYDDARQNYLKAYELIMKNMKQEKGGIKGSDALIMSAGVCKAFIKMGDYQEAEKWLQCACDNLEQYAVQGIPEMVEEYRVHTALYRSSILLGQGKAAQANALFDSIPASHIDRPRSVMEAGEYLMAAGRYAEAAKWYVVLDSIYTQDDGKPDNFSIITEAMVPRFKANLFSGNTSEAMARAIDICQAVDTAVARYYYDNLAEQAVIYGLHEQEKIKEQERIYKEMWRLAAVTLGLLCLVISIGFIIYTRQDRRLKKRSYELLESQRQLQHIESTQEKEDHSENDQPVVKDSKATFKQNLYFRLCDMLEKEKTFTNSDLKREDLAAMLGTNYKYVCDAIRECTSGMSVNEFLNMKRLEYATQLLLSTDMSINEISDAVGFNSRSYFNRLFRSRYEMTPLEYRKTYA